MKRRLAKIAAALGAACFVAAAMAGPATAGTSPVEIYDVQGVSQGIVATFAVRPSIFDPLAQPGILYAESAIDSQGGGTSYSLAAQLYPGKFGVGAVGCSGLKGWVQATYPEAGGCTEEQNDTLIAGGRSSFGAGLGAPQLDDLLNVIQDRTVVRGGEMHAEAHLGSGHTTVTTSRFALLQDPAGPPVVEVGNFAVDSQDVRTESRAGTIARSTAADISILNGVLRIGSLEATATSSSDGITGTATAALTLGDVLAFVNGSYHRATIDNQGVHVRDPDQSREQNLGQSEAVNDALLRAGVAVTAGSPVKIVDGSSAHASVGGLSIALMGTVPTIKVPSELAPVLSQVIKQVPTKCLNDFGGPLPLCFGPGILPGSGSQVTFAMDIGSAAARAVGFGDTYVPPTVGPPPCTTCGAGLPPIQPAVNPGPLCCQQPQPGAPAPAAPPAQVASGPLVGLVARLPASALLWAGVALLILAVGVGIGPSLRNARPR